MRSSFDLLSTVEYGGCSAKLSASQLEELLSDIPILKDSMVMVDISTHDDAGVYRLNDDTALIVTTDFFPPVCSDAVMFGKIAAANALSDVYAMGGTPLLALNINMFPKDIPLEVLRDILMGGQEKINESGAFTMGGHTIEDATPKYGLAVVGTVNPGKVVTNSGLKPGQMLVLTKPLGTGTVMAARRLGMAADDIYDAAVNQMQLLNKYGAGVMRSYGVTGATDVTGFGLLGHAVKMASASGVTVEIYGGNLPVLPGVPELIESGCIAGAAFRNKEFTDDKVEYRKGYDMNMKMAALDAQTSGGLLIGVDADKAPALLRDIKRTGYHDSAAVIGVVTERGEKDVVFI